MPKNFKYDVFLSHSSKDKSTVRELALRLKAEGLCVWFDEWIIQPGDMIGKKTEEGLELSRVLVLAMSRHAFESDWTTLERMTFLFRDPVNKERRFIPLRLDDAEIKATLKQFAFVDWRSKSEDQYARLLRVCRPVPTAEDRDGKQEPLLYPVRVRRITPGVGILPSGQRAVFSVLDNTMRVCDLKTGEVITVLKGHADYAHTIRVSIDERWAISGSYERTIQVWNLKDNQLIGTLEEHTGEVRGVAITADGRRAISGSDDMTVRLWDLEAIKLVATLEGHTGEVRDVAITADGRRIVSGSSQNIRVWDLEGEKVIAAFKGQSGPVRCVTITADGRQAFLNSGTDDVSFWEIPSINVGRQRQFDTTLDTNAKAMIVGESGVGKTGLAYRLTTNAFEASISSDGAWATQMKLSHSAVKTEIDREIWLWDFAGQADYRLIHQLFMDETALAVLVFNPQSENPFEGLGQWDRVLERAARRPFKKLLVAGRIDRGGLMISRESVERFRQERNFVDYIETSALRDTGCDTLRNAIVSHIPWEDIPWTVSPRIFKLIKEEIIKLKDEGKVLLRVSELKQQLELRLPDEGFTLEELRAVIRLLVGPGVVWQLKFGDFVLLEPERVNSYAAAVIRSVRANTEEIGCIGEEDVLRGRLDYQDMERLPKEEEQVVLLAMNQTFVDHGLCLREHTDKGTVLVFPSYFKRERPRIEEHPLVLVTYQFDGPLDEIYATLIVRLHHTAAFEQDRLWRFAADYKTPAGKRLGLKMSKRAEGAAEMEVYFEPDISNEVQVSFLRYVHEHLKIKAQNVTRWRHYVCSHCQTPIDGRKAIEARLLKGFNDVFCGACGEKVLLLDLIEEQFDSERFYDRVRKLEKQAEYAIDNESRELILVGHTYAIAGEAGQIYRQYTNSDHGIDGEIEFKDHDGKASGKRLYLQLKSGDSYLYRRREDGMRVFTIRNERHTAYWQQQAYPVMLVIRTSDGLIQWMNVSEYLKRESKGGKLSVKRVVYEGEPFTSLSLRKLRDRLLEHTPRSLS